MPRNFLVRAAAGVAVSLVALWLVLRSVDLAGDRRRPADGRLALDRGPRRVPLHRPRRPDAPLAAPPRADRRGPVSPHAGLPARRATSRTTSCRPGSASWSGATTPATARASPARRPSARSSSSASSTSSRSSRSRRSRSSCCPSGASSRAPCWRASRWPGCWRSASRSGSPRIACRAPSGSRPGPSATRGSARRSPGCATGCASRAGRGRWSRRCSSARSPGARRSSRSRPPGQSVDVQLTIGQAALLASGVALASAIPAGPASLGTFELAAVEIGKAIGVSSSESVRDRAHRPRLDPRRDVDRRGRGAGLAELAAPGRRRRAEPETPTTPQP